MWWDPGNPECRAMTARLKRLQLAAGFLAQDQVLPDDVRGVLREAVDETLRRQRQQLEDRGAEAVRRGR